MDTVLTLLFIVILVAGLWSNMAALRREWLRSPDAFLKSAGLVALYILYCVAGLWFLASELDGPQGERRALGGTLLLVSWIFYGATWLARLAPRQLPVPAWLDRFPGIADLVLLAAFLTGAWMYWA